MKSNDDMPATECSGKRIKSEMCVYYGPSQQTILSGFSVDFSTGGLFLKTDFPLNVDENITLIFSLPDQEKSVSCKARVTWVNDDKDPCKSELPPGVGVQFVDLSSEELMSISRFIEKYEIKATW